MLKSENLPPANSPTGDVTHVTGGVYNVYTSPVRRHQHRHNVKTRYDFLQTLGRGTYGKVKLAKCKESEKYVAVKTIRKDRVDRVDMKHIRREMGIMSSIQHPNIIQIHEVFENHDKIVIVMEYAAGGELYDYLERKRGVSDHEAKSFFRQIVSAVQFCHQMGIVHRDLKLENILLDRNNQIKIADFGLANTYNKDSLLRTFCGSPLYASPEIITGTPYVGPEVDSWSLGVLLYALVYGTMPFDGSRDYNVLTQQITEGKFAKPPHPSDAHELISSMLRVDPKQRASIEQIRQHSWLQPPTPSSPPLTPPPPHSSPPHSSPPHSPHHHEPAPSPSHQPIVTQQPLPIINEPPLPHNDPTNHQPPLRSEPSFAPTQQQPPATNHQPSPLPSPPQHQPSLPSELAPNQQQPPNDHHQPSPMVPPSQQPSQHQPAVPSEPLHSPTHPQPSLQPVHYTHHLWTSSGGEQCCHDNNTTTTSGGSEQRKKSILKQRSDDVSTTTSASSEVQELEGQLAAVCGLQARDSLKLKHKPQQANHHKRRVLRPKRSDRESGYYSSPERAPPAAATVVMTTTHRHSDPTLQVATSAPVIKSPLMPMTSLPMGHGDAASALRPQVAAAGPERLCGGGEGPARAGDVCRARPASLHSDSSVLSSDSFTQTRPLSLPLARDTLPAPSPDQLDPPPPDGALSPKSEKLVRDLERILGGGARRRRPTPGAPRRPHSLDDEGSSSSQLAAMMSELNSDLEMAYKRALDICVNLDVHEV